MSRKSAGLGAYDIVVSVDKRAWGGCNALSRSLWVGFSTNQYIATSEKKTVSIRYRAVNGAPVAAGFGIAGLYWVYRPFMPLCVALKPRLRDVGLLNFSSLLKKAFQRLYENIQSPSRA